MTGKKKTTQNISAENIIKEYRYKSLDRITGIITRAFYSDDGKVRLLIINKPNGNYFYCKEYLKIIDEEEGKFVCQPAYWSPYSAYGLTDIYDTEEHLLNDINYELCGLKEENLSEKIKLKTYNYRAEKTNETKKKRRLKYNEIRKVVQIFFCFISYIFLAVGISYIFLGNGDIILKIITPVSGMILYLLINYINLSFLDSGYPLHKGKTSKFENFLLIASYPAHLLFKILFF